MKKLILAVLSTALIAGCGATVGRKFDINMANDLQPGVTTLADAKQRLGEPTATSVDGDGNTTLQWRYAHVSGMITNAARLEVLFDKNDKMVRISRKSVVGSP